MFMINFSGVWAAYHVLTHGDEDVFYLSICLLFNIEVIWHLGQLRIKLFFLLQTA